MRRIAYFHTDPGGLECIVNNGHGQHYPWHAHADHATAGLLRAGYAVLATARVPNRALRAGDVFFIPQGEPHSLTVSAGSSLLVLCAGHADSPARQGEPLLRACRKLGIAPEGPERLLALAESRAQSATRAAYPTQGVIPLRRNDRGSAIFEDAARAAADLLHTGQGFDLGLEELADYAGYSPWHFLRGFRKLTGLTPHLFLQLCRLRFLRAQLRLGAPSAALAALAGFTDQSHMHRVFKKHHGLTPRQFKTASFRLEA